MKIQGKKKRKKKKTRKNKHIQLTIGLVISRCLFLLKFLLIPTFSHPRIIH